MEKFTFSFIKSKNFVSGFLTGLIICAAVTILLVSLYEGNPDRQLVKGSLLNWTPSAGDLGTIKWTGDTDSCGRFVGVKFYNDPTSSLIICRPEGRIISGSEVRVNRVTEGQPCGTPSGGIWVSPTKGSQIEIPK
jgi:hypothetical protein